MSVGVICNNASLACRVRMWGCEDQQVHSRPSILHYLYDRYRTTILLFIYYYLFIYVNKSCRAYNSLLGSIELGIKLFLSLRGSLFRWSHEEGTRLIWLDGRNVIAALKAYVPGTLPQTLWRCHGLGRTSGFLRQKAKDCLFTGISCGPCCMS